MFDEDFRAYGFEDIELAFRLVNKGLRVLYNPGAVGYHYKHLAYADVCHRAGLVSAASELFETKEAGRYLKERGSRGGSLSWKRRVKKALAKFMAFMAPFLAPFTSLLDTQIRLPREVYRTLYHCLVVPKAQRKFQKSKLDRGNSKRT